MSHSPTSPQISNNTEGDRNAPFVASNILPTVLPDNETQPKCFAVARGYEHTNQPHTSVIATSDSPSPSTYPDPVVQAIHCIQHLQSFLEAEKAAREAAESRLRAISEAWLDIDRHVQASEAYLSDACTHFSQLLRDPSTRPIFNIRPPYQPHGSQEPAPRAPVAPSQTFPTFPQLSSTTSLPTRALHRDYNAEDVTPPKRIRTDRGPRHSIESSCIHAHALPSYSTSETNHHPHPAYSVQQPPSRGRRPECRDQSLSLSPTHSRSSSMSQDEPLLESTDSENKCKCGSSSSPQPAHAYVGAPSYGPLPITDPCPSLDIHAHLVITPPAPFVMRQCHQSRNNIYDPANPSVPASRPVSDSTSSHFCSSCNSPAGKKHHGQ